MTTDMESMDNRNLAGSTATGWAARPSAPVQEAVAPPAATAAATPARAQMWGWFPALSVISAPGVLLVALAYEGGRLSAPQWPVPLFWCGLLLLFVPVALRLFSAKPTRQERIALLIMVTVNFYLTKYLQYPLYFTSYDEFLHLRSAQDIAASHHLFQPNPLLPISAFYPGLEIVTNAVSSLTGLSIFAAGTLVIGVATLLLVLSLYLLYERLSGSTRLAGLATLLYIANPGFVFFDTMFAYESLALPLAIFVVFAIVRRGSLPARQQVALTLLIWGGLAAVVVTHHLTSFALLAFLCLWSIVSLLPWKKTRARQGQKQPLLAGPREAALVTCVLTILWLIYTNWQAFAYLAPNLASTMNQVTQILAHKAPPRQLFHSNTASTGTPLWERIAAYTSEICILLGLPFGLFAIWRRYRVNAFALTVGCVTLIYPVTLLLHLTQSGAELANRAEEFLFVALAFVLAAGAVQLVSRTKQTGRRLALVAGVVVIIYFGQMVLGSGQPWSLLPGPYMVGADARSIEPEGINAAVWASAYLGPGHIVASDRDNTLLMATFGEQMAQTAGGADVPLSWVLLSPQFGSGVTAILRQDDIQYVVVDLRLSTALPAIGTYFNSANLQPATTPINRAALTKFDGVQNVSRVFDSGDIIIYNVESIAKQPAGPPPTRHFRPARPKKLSQPVAWVRQFYLWDILPL